MLLGNLAKSHKCPATYRRTARAMHFRENAREALEPGSDMQALILPSEIAVVLHQNRHAEITEAVEGWALADTLLFRCPYSRHPTPTRLD